MCESADESGSEFSAPMMFSDRTGVMEASAQLEATEQNRASAPMRR